jgi:hypothetical protein
MQESPYTTSKIGPKNDLFLEVMFKATKNGLNGAIIVYSVDEWWN